MIKRLTPFLAILVVLLAAVALGAASPRTAGAQPSANLFFDNMENGINGWTTSVEGCTTPSEWHQVEGDSKSPTHSWTNSPYTAAGTGECLNHLVSPSFATPLGDPSIFLSFWEHHFTEGGALCNPPTNTPPCDFGQVYISKNGGAFTLAHDPNTRFEGGAAGAAYVRNTFPLQGLFTPGDTLRIRFTFSSDALLAIPLGGWWIDDVSVDTEGPTAVTLTSFAASARQKSVHLSWRTASELGVLGFDVWRSTGAKAVKVNRALVPAKAAGRAGGAAYRLVDRNLRPGTAYTYRLQVVSRDGSRAWRAATKVRLTR
ncbi:MAG: fibronectin type III domain-containing protein [Actinobacteria bacterium]|nr:fibronectin type III domain-containing protein [Actinomycetota bacterium]